MRYAFLLMALVVVANIAAAEPVKIERIDVVDSGIYVVETGEATPDADTPTGEITSQISVENIEQTQTIPGRLGLEFGFQYIVVGSPALGDADLQFVHIYPDEGLKAPDRPEPLLQSAYQRTKKIGETVYLGYGFENEWEIVPGMWIFQIWHDGKKLAEQSFTIE